MNNLRNHKCELLKGDLHDKRVEQLMFGHNTQWFLISVNKLSADVILYCPYCGVKLESEG